MLRVESCELQIMVSNRSNLVQEFNCTKQKSLIS